MILSRVPVWLGLAALASLSATPALAQRAAQASSAAAVSVNTPPPEGFEAGDFVWGGDFENHLQTEVTQKSHGAATSNTYDDANLSLYGNYSTWLSLYSDFKLERNRDDNLDDYYPKSNSFFRSEGLTARQLFAAIRPIQTLSLYGGKIHPNFGSAYENAPGQFYTFGSDYEQDERIGFGVDYILPQSVGLPGAHLSLETYYLDTSPLSISLLSIPKLSDPTADRLRRYTRDQYGPSNTGSLDSFTAALRGGYPERGLSWQMSFTQEATSDPSGKTEYGYSLGGTFDPTGDGIPLGSRLGLTPFAEYTHFDNFQNIADLKRDYVILGATFTYVRWQMAVGGGLRKSSGSSDDFDRQENVSLTYRITPELTAGVGVNHVDIAGEGSWTAGPSLNYEIAF
jgi:hypothetical protein